MAIGQSNMFSAPGDTQLGGNQQLAGASQPTAPSMGIFDTTAPVGQTMNQMQQSQLSPGLFGGFSDPNRSRDLSSVSDPSSMFFDPRRSTPPMMPPSGIGGLRPPPFGGFRPTNPIMNPTPPMMPPGGEFIPPSIGFPPGGIGGFPPSFRPPGMPPSMPPIMPPGMGRPPGMPPGMGRPPGMPPGGIGGFPPNFRPPIFGRPPVMPPNFRPPIFGRPPIMPPNIGRGLGLISPIMAMDSATPMSGGTPMPSLTDEVG